jgi:hypothetical protein
MRHTVHPLTFQQSKEIIMNGADLFKLQARLPAGVKITLVKGAIHYAVRTSRHGRKYSLGTFSDLDAALEALIRFKTKLMDEELTDDSTTAASVLEFEQARDMLDTVGVHNLNAHRSYKHMTEDGNIIVIPAKFVDMYIHLTYYGELPPSTEIDKRVKAGVSADDL